MYIFPFAPELKHFMFNTTNTFSETSTSNETTNDDYDLYKAKESASKLQDDYLGWQSTVQEKKGEDGINTASEYDTWKKMNAPPLVKI